MSIDLQTLPAASIEHDETGEWNEPSGIAPRGTVILLVGRGETPAVYRRFGTRIASDAYRVRTVVDAVAHHAQARGEVALLLADESLPSPKILVGSDTGAALALELASEGLAVDALVIAGLPTRERVQGRGWQDELDARTACSNHQGVLSRAAAQGALWNPLPPQLLGIVSSAVTVPVLAIHGSADTVSPLADALAVYDGLPRREVAVVESGRHDILNDVTHRSVAATVVLFLERLRLDPALAPIVESR